CTQPAHPPDGPSSPRTLPAPREGSGTARAPPIHSRPPSGLRPLPTPPRPVESFPWLEAHPQAEAELPHALVGGRSSPVGQGQRRGKRPHPVGEAHPDVGSIRRGGVH